MKRAHGDSIVNDDEEQPGTRARISALVAGLHVNAAEDDEICSGEGMNDEWLSSWYSEIHTGVHGRPYRAKNGVRVLFPMFPALFVFSRATTPHNTHIPHAFLCFFFWFSVFFETYTRAHMHVPLTVILRVV